MADACPKRMHFGPCADLAPDGGCEVPGIVCPFVAAPAPRWPQRGDVPSPAAERATAATTTATPTPSTPTRPLIICELPEPGNDGTAVRRVAARLARAAVADDGSRTIDAVLFGDSNRARVRFPPSYRAALVQQEGLRAWPGINARDRNRVALEGELLALHDLGVAGVHCVTGNHPHSGHRPDALPVFDLDATRLASLAAGIGHEVSVAASPHTPPVQQRAVRTADKAAAGASWAFIDQPVDADEVRSFVQQVRRAGAKRLRFAALITVPLRADDLVRLLDYPNARVPADWGDAMASAGDDGHTRGVRLATDLARALLGVEGVEGVLLGATTGPEHADELVDAFAEVACALCR